jgi:hypothetical protein
MATIDDDLHAAQLATLQAIQRDLGVIASRDQDAINLMRDSVKELRMIVTGADGTNGLRSVVKEHETILRALQQWKIQAATLFLIIQVFAVPTILFFLQKFLSGK